MKRLILRLSAVTSVIVLGLIAIAYAQRGGGATPRAESPAKLPPRLSRDRAATPIPNPSRASGGSPFDTATARAAGSRSNPTRSRGAVRSEQADQNIQDAPRAQRDDIPPAREVLGAADEAESSPGERRRERSIYEDAPAAHPFSTQAYTEREPARNYDVRQAAAEEPAAPRSRFADAAATTRAGEPGRFEAAADAELPATGTEPSDLAAPDASNRTQQAPEPGRQEPADGSFPPAAGGAQASAGEGTGRPGASQLEGAQSPSITIEKSAPAEIQVGKPATFTIIVRNVGSAAAAGIDVHDEVPQGTQLIGTKPGFAASPDGKLVWNVGTLKPGDEAKAEIELMPVAEGEIGSVATVHFRAEASVRTVSTKPQIALEVTAPPKVMIGEEVTLKIKVSNSGTGAATGVIITETVPAGLKHISGGELEFEVGTLKPGETRKLELALTAAEAGPVANAIVARADAGVQVDAHADFEVIAPGLKVGVNGPKKRYLGRLATYNMSVSNPGTAAAKDVELVTVLPKGLKFVEANNQGQYDAATHSVYWSLEELPAQETGSVMLKAMPIEAGDQRLQLKGQAKQGLKDEREETIVIEGLAAILFELVDVQDPIEVGGETTYEVRVINQGSKAATNVQLVAILPAGLKAVSADGPVRHVIDRNKNNEERVYFDALAQLAPKADTTYSIKVQGTAPGDQRIQVKLQSEEVRDPITKEESTRVYSDE